MLMAVAVNRSPWSRSSCASGRVPSAATKEHANMTTMSRGSCCPMPPPEARHVPPLLFGDERHVAAAPHHARTHVVAAPLAEQVQLGIAYGEPGEAHPLEWRRQPRLPQRDTTPHPVDVEPQQRLHDEQR